MQIGCENKCHKIMLCFNFMHFELASNMEKTKLAYASQWPTFTFHHCSFPSLKTIRYLCSCTSEKPGSWGVEAVNGSRVKLMAVEDNMLSESTSLFVCF